MSEEIEFVPYSGVLQGQIIGCTGSGPYEEEYIKNFIHNELGILGNKDIWQQDQVIIVGKESYDKIYLEFSVKIGKNLGFKCKYMSQDDFLNLYQYGGEVSYWINDIRVKKHPGLSFISSIDSGWMLSIPVKRVKWQILPPGKHSFSQIINHFRRIEMLGRKEKFDEDRLHFIQRLGPDYACIGTDEFKRYVIFYFGGLGKAVLECPRPGNAIYVIEGEWEDLAQYTKAELLYYFDEDVRKVVHKGDWQSRLLEILDM